MPRFKFGDRVEVSGHRCIVRSVRIDTNGNYHYVVKWDSEQLIPREMEYPEMHLNETLKLYNRFIDTSIYCPLCENKWHKTAYGNNVWFDCLRCGKKKEDIVK
jgi:hypothetical protein